MFYEDVAKKTCADYIDMVMDSRKELDRLKPWKSLEIPDRSEFSEDADYIQQVIFIIEKTKCIL
jgi:hypothetical protein